MTITDLYRQITHDQATHHRTIAAALARQSSRRRRAVALRAAGRSLRAIGAALRPPCSFGAADDLITRTMMSIAKEAQGLPRYHHSGRGQH